MKKPNILFAIADDASHFGIYGHSFVKTPNIDWVAKQGVIFENAFTSNPKCAPSRATILTGKYTWELEDGCNHFGYFPKGFEVYPDLLENAGYFVGYTGKPWGPGDYEHYGRSRNPVGNEYKAKKLSPPENSHISSCDYAENFRDFLNDKKDEDSFCFWYGGIEPHRSYSYQEGIRGGKNLDEIDSIPPYWPNTEEVKTDMLDYAYEIEWFDSHLGKMIDILKEKGEYENTLIIVTSDNGCPFPRVKGQMYEQDFHLPMVACWGDVCTGGRKVSDLISFTDLAPTFLDVGGAEIPEEMTGKSFKDILTSDKSGLIDSERVVTYFGREKHDLGRENDLGYPVRCIRDTNYLYIKNFAPERWPAGNPETGYTNCDSSPTKEVILDLNEKGESFYYNLAFGKRPKEEMYDIISDPECMINLALNKEFDDLRAKMEQDLMGFLVKTKDPRVCIESDYFEKFLYVGNGNHSWKDYVEGTFRKQKY